MPWIIAKSLDPVTFGELPDGHAFAIYGHDEPRTPYIRDIGAAHDGRGCWEVQNTSNPVPKPHRFHLFMCNFQSKVNPILLRWEQ